jgi:hypothetical protein
MLVDLFFNFLFVLVVAVVTCFLLGFVLCFFSYELVLDDLDSFGQETEWSAQLVNKNTHLSEQLYVLLYFQLNSNNFTLKVLGTLDDVINFEQNLGSLVVCFLFVEPELCVFGEILVFNLFDLDLCVKNFLFCHCIHQVDNKGLSVIFDIELERLFKHGRLATLPIGLHHFVSLVHHHKTLLYIGTHIFCPYHKNFEDALRGLLAVTLRMLKFDLVFL